MSLHMKLLSDISFMAGIIGYAEYCERYEIADWLMDSVDRVPDPRISDLESEAPDQGSDEQEERVEPGGLGGSSTSGNDEPPWLELLVMNRWMFTIGDVDCYPSVPHGHYKSKTKVWPKLNPYTGLVFSDVHKEDIGKRLSKKEMKKLWNKSSFVEHCREQVLWYSGFAPSYGFPGARRGKFVFPRWR